MKKEVFKEYLRAFAVAIPLVAITMVIGVILALLALRGV